ncbi:MAG TPA: membrane protein insertase YidC [Prolixibacteraceae bacterium]|nr:membrane protein insertase YidC [Prolixibacteraceae bacterium]
MDRNSIIGIILIFAVLVVFSIVNQPSKEEIEAMKHRQDSIQQVEAAKALQLQQQQQQQQVAEQVVLPDSVVADQLQQEKINQFGIFGAAALGEETFYTLENNLVKLTFSNKGGRIYSVELKEYKTYDGKPLILFDGPETQFGLNFFAQNRNIQTDQLYFSTTAPASVKVSGPDVKVGHIGMEKFNDELGGGTESVSFRLEVQPGSYLEYVYTLKYNTYMVDFNVKMEGMNRLVASNQSYLNFTWSFDVPRQERKSQFGEDRYTNIYYKFFEADVDKLSPTKSDQEDLSTRTKWIGMKQLFFTSTIIADDYFPIAQVRSERFAEDNQYLANFYAGISLPYEGKPNEAYGMSFYFGPNHFQTLRQYKIDLEQQVYLGYSIVRPVNRYLIIPVFNFLRTFISNFGIIILLLTIFIKLILFPFTYKSYMSQAKMRVLKPEIDEINAKFGNEKAVEKQQAVMALYKKAGVNPMGGCLPMLLQFPILIAMFFFFPTSIELRQESFLWATDLSTYDSILDLPFTIPFYGDHVSLFCLLMTATTIFSTYLNMQTSGSTSMPGMKTMMYMMPVVFLFILNNYSSGLSYYYFLANVITIGQTYVVRGMVDENKIRAQIQLNKKKPVAKSKFQQRLEQLAKERGVQPPKK